MIPVFKRHIVTIFVSVLLAFILFPYLLQATIIPDCVSGQVEDNVEDGIHIDGGECGILDVAIPANISGNLEVLNGDLTVNGSISQLSGSIVISAGSTLTLNGSLLNMDGSISVYGTLIITGVVTATGKLVIDGSGTVTLDGGSFASSTDGVEIKGGTVVNMLNGSTITASTEVKNDGEITSDGTGNTIVGGITGSGILPVEFQGGCDPCLDSSALPVELLFFTSSPNQNQVDLIWSTASELNNDFFTLEKSNNGSDFVKLGEVIGNGTTNVQMDYSFTDHSPYLGLSYYRLSQTDYDGTTEVFPVVSVLFEGNKSFSLGPNPVSGSSIKLKISEMGKYELLELNIVDLQGRLVEKKQFKTDSYGNVEAEIHLDKPLKKGTYIFELVSAQNRTYQKVAAE